VLNDIIISSTVQDKDVGLVNLLQTAQTTNTKSHRPTFYFNVDVNDLHLVQNVNSFRLRLVRYSPRPTVFYWGSAPSSPRMDASSMNVL